MLAPAPESAVLPSLFSAGFFTGFDPPSEKSRMSRSATTPVPISPIVSPDIPLPVFAGGADRAEDTALGCGARGSFEDKRAGAIAICEARRLACSFPVERRGTFAPEQSGHNTARRVSRSPSLVSGGSQLKRLLHLSHQKMYVSKDAPTCVRLLVLIKWRMPPACAAQPGGLCFVAHAYGLREQNPEAQSGGLCYFGSSLMKTLRNHNVLPWCCNSIWPVGYIGLFRSQ